MHKKSIFLVGLMGSGKSSVGRILADKLHYHFVDSDHIIEDKTGVSIPMIFDIEGEVGFRQREEYVIDDLTQLPETILATGGGAILNEENRKNLRSRGFVVYLKSSVNTLMKRTRNDRNRPLLQTANPQKILTDLLEQREPYYLEVSDLVIETEFAPIYKVVREIISKLEQENVV